MGITLLTISFNILFLGVLASWTIIKVLKLKSEFKTETLTRLIERLETLESSVSRLENKAILTRSR